MSSLLALGTARPLADRSQLAAVDDDVFGGRR
jgi:hypothetical protein